MSQSLQDKLLRHEVTPPQQVWEQISLRLDNEFSVTDSKLSSKLEEAAIAPPPLAWDKISEALDPAPLEKTTKSIPLFIRRSAIAAAIAILLIAGSIYFFNNDGSNHSSGNTSLSQVQPGIAPAPVTVDSIRKVTDVQPDSAKEIEQPIERPRSARIKPVRAKIAPEENNQILEETPVSPPIESSNVNSARTVSALQPIAVSAPPLRDGNGDIIMDMDLISKPGQQYITVTSPNGNQARLSNKFLNCLRYINGNSFAYDNDRDAVACRNKFDEWRQKLLSEATFMPSSDNFFDIFELKELIEE